MNVENCGSSFDDFLRDEGIYEEVTAAASLRVIAWQLQEEMKVRGISKSEMAVRMHTSRSQLDRILKGTSEGVRLDTLENAARAVGRSIRMELA